MTDREEDRPAFLVRWSRRKREAAANRPEPPAEERPASKAAGGERAAAPPSEPPPPPATREPELPPIESIDAATDVRGFLEQGVPQDLTRAALRRAWHSDPAIRDFVGLSENAWDFTAPDGVPGFGSFAPDAARQLIAQVLGGQPSDTAPSAASAVAEPKRSAKDQEPEHEVVKPAEIEPREAQPAGGVGAPEEPISPGRDSAMQQRAAEPELPPRSTSSPSK